MDILAVFVMRILLKSVSGFYLEITNMQNDDGFALQRWQCEFFRETFELLLTAFVSTPRTPHILVVQQPVLAKHSILLYPPLMKYDHIGPKLCTAERFCPHVWSCHLLEQSAFLRR